MSRRSSRQAVDTAPSHSMRVRKHRPLYHSEQLPCSPVAKLPNNNMDSFQWKRKDYEAARPPPLRENM